MDIAEENRRCRSSLHLRLFYPNIRQIIACDLCRDSSSFVSESPKNRPDRNRNARPSTGSRKLGASRRFASWIMQDVARNVERDRNERKGHGMVEKKEQRRRATCLWRRGSVKERFKASLIPAVVSRMTKSEAISGSSELKSSSKGTHFFRRRIGRSFLPDYRKERLEKTCDWILHHCAAQ